MDDVVCRIAAGVGLGFLAVIALVVQFATFGLAGLYSLLDFLGAVLLFVLPQSLFASVIFAFHVQPFLLAQFRRTDTALSLSKGTIRIDT